MALADLTVNTDHVYVVTSVGAGRAVRSNFDSNDVGSDAGSPATIEIAHTPGKGKKPDRRLLKIAYPMAMVDESQAQPLSFHLVATVPKGTVGSIVNHADIAQESIAKAMYDLIGNSAFLKQWIQGGLG
jgi:hypothetical protein